MIEILNKISSHLASISENINNPQQIQHYILNAEAELASLRHNMRQPTIPWDILCETCTIACEDYIKEEIK